MQHDNEANSIDDFGRRFSALADEAARYGIATCVILDTDDPISGKSRLTEIMRGSRMRTIGMLQQAIWHTQSKG
jgi:hypothetical protein